jgi:hypothetical protein
MLLGIAAAVCRKMHGYYFLPLASSKHCGHPLVLAATIMHPKVSMAAAKREKDPWCMEVLGTELNFNLVMPIADRRSG